MALAHLFTLLALLTAQPSASQTQSEAPGPAGSHGVPGGCMTARALAAVGETEAAREDLVKELRRDPSKACAQKKLHDLNAPAESPSCAEADQAFDAGKLDQAKTAYERLGGAECGKTGLAAVREVEGLCEQGAAYKAVHRDEDALSAFKAALEKAPNAECATAGVAELSPMALTRGLDWLSSTIPEILLGLALVLAGLFVLLLLGYFQKLRPWLVRAPIIGRIIAPRMTFGALDDEAVGFKVGVPMAARIKERLQRFRDEALLADIEPYDMDVGTSAEEFVDVVSESAGLQDALGKVGEISEQVSIATVLLDLLYTALPIQRLTVGGVLDPPAKSVTAVTLALEDGSRMAAGVRLENLAAAEKPEAPDFLALSDSAAVWVQYEVARVLGGDIAPDKAESYALVREGLDYAKTGADSPARIAFQQALALDPRNWAAHVNLAVTEARLANNLDRAIAILRTALEEMERDG